MIQTLKAQFYTLLGSSSATGYLVISEDMIDDFVSYGLHDLVHLVRQYNPTKLHHFGVVESITAQLYDASAIDMDMIISITRDLVISAVTYNKLVRQVPYARRGVLTDIGSKHYAIKANPGGFFDEDNKLTIYPIPTVSEKGYLEYVKFADPDVGTNDSIADITGCRFPDSLTRAVLLFAVIQAKIREFGYVRQLGKDHVDAIFVAGSAELDSETFTNQTLITITHNLGYIPIITIVDTNGKEMFGLITHNNPTFTIATITFVVAQSGTWQTSLISTGGLFALYQAALSSWSAVTYPTLPTAITPGVMATATFSLPTYTAPVFTSVPVPTPPTIGSLTFPGVPVLSKDLPTYAAIDFSGVTSPTVLSNTKGDVPVIDILSDIPPAIDTTRIINALNQAGDLIQSDPTGSPTDTITADAESFLVTHDSDVANAAVSAAQAAVAHGRAEIEAEKTKWDKYQLEIQHAVGKLQSEAQAYNAEKSTVIKEFEANIRKYTTDVEKTVKAWVEENKLKLDNFAADSKNTIDSFRAEAEADVGAFTAEQQAEVSNYNAAVADYSAQVKKIIDENAIVNKTAIDIFSAELEERVQEYRAEQEMAISNYRANSEAIINKYRADVENEAQRGRTTNEKAMTYLKAIEDRLNLVRMYFSKGESFVNEVRELQNEYLRRVMSFCGVIPQNRTEQRR